MKKVLLTVGPRGVGKSSYCKKVVEQVPLIMLISRDEILIELFGSTELSPYGGGHWHAQDIFFKKVQEKLVANQECTLLLDYWTGFQTERKALIEKVRGYGADEIDALYFVTPLETCVEWFMQKDESTKYAEEGWMEEMRVRNCKNDFALYHREAAHIANDGFDRIVHINPCQQTLKLMTL